MVSSFQLFIQDSCRFEVPGLTHCVKVFLMLSLPTLPDWTSPWNWFVRYNDSQRLNLPCDQDDIFHPQRSHMYLSDKAVWSIRIWCCRKILVAFVYIYCLLECFSVWVFSVSCRNVWGVLSCHIARGPRADNFSRILPSFLMRWFIFCFTLCSDFPQ